jgi:hypothetical protein
MTMSGKIITAAAVAILIGSTALASAQTRAQPRYWGGGDYYGPGVTFGFGVGPGYYDYAPGYYAPGYAPRYYAPGYDDRWNDRWEW